MPPRDELPGRETHAHMQSNAPHWKASGNGEQRDPERKRGRVDQSWWRLARRWRKEVWERAITLICSLFHPAFASSDICPPALNRRQFWIGQAKEDFGFRWDRRRVVLAHDMGPLETPRCGEAGES
eukprot:2349822-Rhodomonas_salina.1